MEIPKIKILIYILTFIGYAWSGYGSGILLNLRDAIISAENFFGDFLGNVIEFSKKFKNLPDIFNAAAEEKCQFTCPSGIEPVKNKYHKPTTNGYGRDFLKSEIKKYLPNFDFTECWNKHDLCYDTCNSDKTSCDLEFQKCLFKLCDNVTNTTLIKACKAAAKVLYTSAMTLGCTSYLDAQKKACYCPVDNKKKYSSGNEL